MMTRWLALLVLAAAPTATAQWASLDRMDETIKVQFQTAIVLDKDSLTDGFVFSYNELYFAGAYKGFGGYLNMPIAALTNGSYSVSTLGDLEAGVLWDVALPLLNLTLRAGVAAPTVRSDSDSQYTIGVASWCRLTDLALTVPDVVGVRLGTSIRLPAGILFGRADTGFDLLIPVGPDVSASDFDTIFRVNLGLGVFWHGFGGSLEYVLATRVVDTKISFQDGVFPHTLTLAARFQLPWVELFVAGTLPLANTIIGELGSVSIGVSSRLMVEDGEVSRYPESY